MQVGKNGVIFFDKLEFNFDPTPFPGAGGVKQSFVVAPFWAVTDIGSPESQVCYDVFNRDSTGGADDTILDQVSQFVEVREGLANGSFQAQWMLLAEWNSVHPHPFDDAASLGLSPTQMAALSRVS